MSYQGDDKTVFPTRTGGAVGSSVERKMLDAVQGAEGIRKQIRANADGSTTLLVTRAGNPEFITTKPTVEPEENAQLFLQTGFCEFPEARSMAQYTGPGSTRGKWWFHVAPSSYWLGYIKVDKHVSGKQDASANKRIFKKFQQAPQPLYDGMVAPALSAAQQTDEWLYSLFDKSEAMSACPASMFSGKMRLFVQAQYGRLMDKKRRIRKGASSVLIDDVELSNLGGVGTGLFTTDDNEYRVVRIVDQDVFIFEIEPEKKYKALLKPLFSKLKDPDLGQAEREKVEAYIFAHCKIKEQPTWSLIGVLPSCNPVCYGWSFTWLGKTADIVSHAVVGEGNAARFHSTHYRLSITNFKAGAAESWAVSYETVSTDIWADGRGSYHIWSPDYQAGGRHYLFSLGIPVASVPSADGKIACYYDKTDSLKVLRYFLSPRQSYGVTTYATTATWPGGSDNTVSAYLDYATQQGGGTAEYLVKSPGVSGTEAFFVGAAQFGGAFDSRSVQKTVIHHGSLGAGNAVIGWWGFDPFGLLRSDYGPIIGGDGLASAFATYYSDSYVDKARDARSYYDQRSSERETYPAETVGRKYHAAVIPFYDCCAFFVFERDTFNTGSITFSYQQQTSSAHVVYYSEWIPFGDQNHPLCIRYSGKVGPGNDRGYTNRTILFSEYRTTDRGPIRYKKSLVHFHGAEEGSPGESSSLLDDLFIVDNANPYYDSIVYTSLPCSGKVEIDNPLRSNGNRRWTGWV